MKNARIIGGSRDERETETVYFMRFGWRARTLWRSQSPFCCKPNIERDSRVGAVLREQNALPYKSSTKINLTAKDAIENGGAGRAAKSANPSLCAKKGKESLVLSLPFLV